MDSETNRDHLNSPTPQQRLEETISNLNLVKQAILNHTTLDQELFDLIASFEALLRLADLILTTNHITTLGPLALRNNCILRYRSVAEINIYLRTLRSPILISHHL